MESSEEKNGKLSVGEVGELPQEFTRMIESEEAYFPFTAIVSQQLMKRAVAMTIINPKIKTLILNGPRGTAKSTITSSIKDLASMIDVNDGCRFNCDPKSKD